jgi:hypothetical protein
MFAIAEMVEQIGRADGAICAAERQGTMKGEVSALMDLASATRNMILVSRPSGLREAFAQHRLALSVIEETLENESTEESAAKLNMALSALKASGEFFATQMQIDLGSLGINLFL